jgi:hypothetical protein
MAQVEQGSLMSNPKDLPFNVKLPNRVTLKAMVEAEHPENLETYDSFDDFYTLVNCAKDSATPDGQQARQKTANP